MNEQPFQVGDRVRLACACPGTNEGDTAVIQRIYHDDNGAIVRLLILVDTTPETTHGTTVFPHEVQITTPASGATL